MNILSCRTCGVEFESKSPSKRYCGGACAEAGVPSHGTSGYRQGCRCGVCRGAQNLAVKAHNAKVRERDGVSAMAKYRRKSRGQDESVVIPCTVCGEPLKRIAAGKGKPVHKECLASRSYLRNGFTESVMVRRFRAKLEKAAAGTTGGKRVFVSGGCEWCGKHFVAAGGKYCTDECRASSSFSRRSSGKTFNIPPRVRLAIYERDSWICQLCTMPVNGSLHYRSRWSASLDHVIPRSHQIVPDHSPSNLRLAHVWCNSARGDGSNMSEDEAVSRAIALLKAEAAMEVH